MNHFIISDLHLNMGKQENGKLHPLEDYDSDEAFSKLLETIQQRRGQLVINGDWVDFLQLEPFWEAGGYFSQTGIPLGWTWKDAQKKLETVFRTQKRHFSDLASFLKQPGSKLTIMQGNHDPDWFFPPVDQSGQPPLQKMLRQQLGSPPEDRVEFRATSLRVGSVHIEHGHQQCEPMNAFQDHPNIFHADKKSPIFGEPRYELLWGSRFVLSFFNNLEMTRPFADNLKTMTRALLLGIKNKWVNAGTAADVLKFFWGSGIPWRDIPELLDRKAADAIRMLQEIPNPEVRAYFFDRLQSDPGFAQELSVSINSTPREELSRFRKTDRLDIGNKDIQASEPGTLGIFRDAREVRQARMLLEQPGLTSVIFGHTHQEIDGHDPTAPLAGYFNTGTWTPRFDLGREENQVMLRQGTMPEEVLSDRSRFELRLMYAEIDDQAGTVELKEVS